MEIRNRLEKNLKKLKPWADRLKIEAYRIYDRDIPDYPYILDLYKDQLVIYDRRDEKIDADPKKESHHDELIQSAKDLLGFKSSQIHIKERRNSKGGSQYGKMSDNKNNFTIQEGPAKFWINLTDYLDTGLFLDHRIMRQKIYESSDNKEVLNLFSYTGSVSVFAALGGAHTTSVDMSNTYTDWTKDNFRLNHLTIDRHNFITEDVFKYLKEKKDEKKFDIIFLDPPTFSNSKRMDDDFEVEKDQLTLINSCMTFLKPKGVLYFSNNKRSFKLDPSIALKYQVKDISTKTIPSDFRDQKIHHVFEIT